MMRAAVISACGRYRYSLSRQWKDDDSYAVFIMLNPSTADAEKDDPTIRRCIAYAKAWGYGGLVVVNLFAFRATHPDFLLMQHPGEIVGPENDEHIREACVTSQVEVAAWGTRGALLDRDEKVRKLIPDLKVLRLTKEGYPSHPLYLPKNLTPVEWRTS